MKSMSQSKIDQTGKPVFIDINKILDAAEEYMKGDDGQKGLWILDNLPSYYQDHYPLRAYEIKRSYFKRLWTMEDYLSNEFDNQWDEVKALDHYKQPYNWRGQHVQQIVKHHHDNGAPVHIYELGAANHWLPIGLRSEGLKFTYKSIGPDVHANKQAKEKLSDIWSDNPEGSIIFVCMETIEHCMNPMDLFNYYCKLPREAEYLLLTTPRYMIGGSSNYTADWREKDHGHVKTWGAKEFNDWAKKTFKLHSIYTHDKFHLVVTGVLKRLERMAETVKTVDDREA